MDGTNTGRRDEIGLPTREHVDDLIRQAAGHPLGTDFLKTGSLDSVAATFQVHAFVVDAARDALGGDTVEILVPRTASAASVRV